MANDRLYGYHGVLLEVDLTSGKSVKVPLGPDDARRFIGGRGLGMKILASCRAHSQGSPSLRRPGRAS